MSALCTILKLRVTFVSEVFSQCWSAGIFAQLHLHEQIKEARFKTNSGSVKVQYEDSTKSGTVTDSPVIVSSCRHSFLCSNRVVELRPDLILGLQVFRRFQLPWRLLSWFQVTPPETRRSLSLLYLSGWCAVWCAELLTVNCEAPGGADAVWTGQRAGELPEAALDCPENWCQMRVTAEVKRGHEICIEMCSSSSQTAFEILFSSDWWIDLDSQTGTKWEKNTNRLRNIAQIQPKW